MNRGKPVLLMALILLLPGCSEPPQSASGFAGLAASGSEEGDFRQPGPGDTLAFPQDFGPHPRYRIEWWYLTANLETARGEPLGLQWTQFRQALTPRDPEVEPPEPRDWPLQAAWMAHAAVSFRESHRFAEKFARGDIGHAGARAAPFEVWLDDWSLRSNPQSGAWRLQVSAKDWSYDLRLRSTAPPVAHGQGGFSAKSASGEGSMYFSLVDLEVEGTVTLGDQIHQVTGEGWFDREWSSQFLKAGQQGWDWFALHLESGADLMVFRLREGEEAWLSGTWISDSHQVVALAPGELTLTPEQYRDTPRGRVPDLWRLQVPGQGIDVELAAPPGNYWNEGRFPYWESPVTASGSVSGSGYMELTGYGQ